MGSVTQWMESDRPTIIYGAGRQAETVYRFGISHGKKFLALMTSGDRNRNGSLPGEEKLPFLTPDTYKGDRSSVDVILSFGGGQRLFTRT